MIENKEVTSHDCPVCGVKLAVSNGMRNATIALIDSEIGREDYNRGQIYAKRYSYNGTDRSPQGHVIFQEVARAGLPVQNIMYTALWMHPKPDGKKTDYACMEYLVPRLMDEVQQCSHILLMGADAVSFLARQPILYTMGLEIQVPLFAGKKVVIAPSPTQVIETTVGEFRNALSVFNMIIRRDK